MNARPKSGRAPRSGKKVAVTSQAVTRPPDAIGDERRGASRRALGSVLLSRELDVHQAVRARKRKGPQQYRLYDAVDTRGGADADRKREHRHGRKPGALGERADCVAEVIHVATPPADRPASPAGRGGSSPTARPRRAAVR